MKIFDLFLKVLLYLFAKIHYVHGLGNRLWIQAKFVAQNQTEDFLISRKTLYCFLKIIILFFIP